MRISLLRYSLGIALSLICTEVSAVFVCTRPLPRTINRLIAQGANIDPSEIKKQQAQFCYEYPQIPNTQGSEDIGRGCIMYSGYIKYGETVYWAVCAEGNPQDVAPRCFMFTGERYCD